MSSEVVKLAPSQLPRYDEMCRAIEVASEVDEVLEIRNRAAALALYARQARNFRIRAERRCGQMLRDMQKAKGGGDQKSDHRSDRPRGDLKTLSDLGISHDQSSQWQRLANCSDEVFETALRNPRENRPTTTSVLWWIDTYASAAAYRERQRAAAEAGDQAAVQHPPAPVLRLVESREQMSEGEEAPYGEPPNPSDADRPASPAADDGIAAAVQGLEGLAQRFGLEILRADWFKFNRQIN